MQAANPADSMNTHTCVLIVNMARAADKTASIEHYIWSTLRDSSELMGRKFWLPHVDYKAIVDKRIRSELPELAARTTYYVSPYYAQNIVLFPFLRPLEVVSATTSHVRLDWGPESLPSLVLI